ncbi:MAG: DUF4407 domain-containing protein [Schleiferiaceae bacterium]|nr:DUF4407 domain-containing protein [Schleiferiaceae bacterium]
MKNLWIRLGCFITGWNYTILSGCTEASKKQIKKYTSAIFILIILWGFIGYSFAQRYIGLDWMYSSIVALVFIVLIIQIERQIILTVGSNKLLGIFRFIIALIMAILGSAIIDQIIFKDDIEKKMIEIVEHQVEEQLGNRVRLIDEKIFELRANIENISEKNSLLYSEISAKPTTMVVSSITQPMAIKRDGLPDSIVNRTTVNRNPIPNPKIDEARINDKLLDQMREQLDNYLLKKLDVQDNLRAEISSKQGFLEELTTTISILKESIVALVFYIILFVFFVSLELFVVASKIFDKKSDYDLVIEHQLSQKKKTLDELIK